jgi:TP901 family phage tail tape measure protein
MAGKRVLEAVVRVRADTRNAQRGIQQMNRGWQAMGQWTQRLRAGMLGMNTMMMGSGAAMVAGGIAARSAVRNYTQYTQAQGRIRAVLASSSADISLQTELMQTADAASRQWGHSLHGSAEAMGTMLETGLSAHEAVQFYTVAAEFARAANTDLEGSTRVLVDAMRQFDDISSEGARNLAATITVASRISSTSVEEMQQSMRYAGVELSAMGYEADETAAALGALSAIGLRGTTAGTRLRGAVLALTRITGRSRNIMTQYGLEHERLNNTITDEEGNLRTLSEASSVLSGIFQDLPTHAAKLNLATALFGRRAYAAGVVLSGLHERSDEFTRVLGELSDEELNQARMTEAAEEQMRSFSAQMDLAKVAGQELGVSFMEMLMPLQEGRQGFGQWLTDLGLATRGADGNARMTAIMREQYEALTPEMRETGHEVRETLDGIVQLLRVLGQVGRAIGSIVAINPQFALGFVLVYSAVRPLIPGLIQAGMAAQTSGTKAAVAAASWRNLGIASRAARFGIGLLIVDLAGRGSRALTSHIAEVMGVTNEYERAASTLPDWVRAIAQIPVIGPWVDQFARLLNLMRRAGMLADEIEQRGQPSAVGGPISRDERNVRARREREAQVIRASSMMMHAGITGREGIRGELLRQGFDERQVAAMAGDMARQQGLVGRAGITEGEVFGRDMSGSLRANISRRSGLGLRTSTTAAGIFDELRSSMRQVQQIGLEDYRASGQAGGIAMDREVFSARNVRDQDVDTIGGREQLGRAIVDNRRELLEAMRSDIGRRDPNETADFGGSRKSSDVNFTADLNIEIPVRMNDREIARIIGERFLQVNERRGATIEPGSRRRVAEQGVQ